MQVPCQLNDGQLGDVPLPNELLSSPRDLIQLRFDLARRLQNHLTEEVTIWKALGFSPLVAQCDDFINKSLGTCNV